ncbi:Crp/Fnr family transcriptional regulator [Pedobacter sp. WC2423]|uniref:Crp/Fnr family transcriptional regulator n=1 Tax=Pedobacter sp. WC2423 TaxID=3234142 RepID=UPI003465F883
MNKLEEKLLSMASADKRGIEDLLSLFMPISFRKGLIIGTPEHSYPILHFIESGLLMGNYIVDDKEYPSWISDHGFVLPIGGFLSKKNYSEFIMVLENSQCWYLNLAKAEILAQKNYHLYRMLLEIFEENLQLTREREISLRIPNAYERYLKFMNEQSSRKYPLTNSVLASLLSINEKHLSKLKRRYVKS